MSDKNDAKVEPVPTEGQAPVDGEKMVFQAEVNQLLQLMIHSLYSNQEIFLRELISNCSDACDKLRFESIENADLLENDTELRIIVSADKEAGTVTVIDNGIGMNREEVIANIGTIAKSGTKQFLESLSGDKKADAKLIGQFGVGFYSSFVVADSVVLVTRKAGDGSDAGVRWESDASGGYTIVCRGQTGPGDRDNPASERGMQGISGRFSSARCDQEIFRSHHLPNHDAWRSAASP